MNVEQAIETASRIVSNNANTNFGFFGKTNEVHHADAPCHGGAQSPPKVDEVTYYYTSIPNYSAFGDVENRVFIDFITSAEGPWRQFFKDRFSSVLESKKGIACGYFVEVRPDDDRTVLCSMSIASRLPREAKSSYPVFFQLLQEGLNREEAFFLAHFFQSTGKSFNTTMFAGHTHSAVGEYKFNLKAFEEGKPKPSKIKLVDSAYGVDGIQDRWYLPINKSISTIHDDIKDSLKQLKGRWVARQATIEIPDLIAIWKEKSRNELLSVCS